MNLRLDKHCFRKDNLDYNAFEGYTKKIGKKILFKGGFGNAETNRTKFIIRNTLEKRKN